MAALPYERRESETDPAWGAFILYRDMGLDRSLAKVAAQLGKSDVLMSRWSSHHGWRKRVLAYDMEADRRQRIGALKGIEDMRRRHTRLAQRLQHLGHLELEKLVKAAEKHAIAGTLDSALVLKLIEQGAKMERVVRGEPGEIIETHTTDAPDLSGLTLDELKVMRAIRVKLTAQRENDTVH